MFNKYLKIGENSDFRVLVFKTPRDISDLGAQDDMFGFTMTVKMEIKKLLTTTKIELLKYSKRMQDLIESLKKASDFKLLQMNQNV